VVARQQKEEEQGMAFVTMNTKALTRLRVIQDLISDAITPKIAAKLLNITTRQLRTLRAGFAEYGPAGLASIFPEPEKIAH